MVTCGNKILSSSPTPTHPLIGRYLFCHDCVIHYRINALTHSLPCDPGGILTHDFRNRNPTFYTAELRGLLFHITRQKRTFSNNIMQFEKKILIR